MCGINKASQIVTDSATVPLGYVLWRLQLQEEADCLGGAVGVTARAISP